VSDSVWVGVVVGVAMVTVLCHLVLRAAARVVASLVGEVNCQLEGRQERMRDRECCGDVIGGLWLAVVRSCAETPQLGEGEVCV